MSLWEEDRQTRRGSDGVPYQAKTTHTTGTAQIHHISGEKEVQSGSSKDGFGPENNHLRQIKMD